MRKQALPTAPLIITTTTTTTMQEIALTNVPLDVVPT
jgi:hypothetical protein